MKRLSILFIIFLIATVSHAQKIDGQWRGYFDSKGDIIAAGQDNTEYVLEINLDGTDISGYSYSYFQDRKYYVICTIKGTYNKSDKTMLITEVARIKGITPPGQGDCLQTHFLQYQKIHGKEQLVGKWKSAPGQNDCGSGSTTLERKTLNKNLVGYNKGRTRITITRSNIITTESKPKRTETIIRRRIPPTSHLPVSDSSVVDIDLTKKDTTVSTVIIDSPAIERKTIPITPPADMNYEKRSNTLLNTIQIASDSFQVDLYDSGDIDGDSISLFFDGKLLLSHQGLAIEPITLTLNAKANNGVNELVMYAETLGTIPPNTALMVVTDGSKRYEIYMTSDLQESGAVRFIHKNE
ncbi:MAG TPA: hypothetical protein VK718_03870 [Ferruginibacter sp.]|jgi:hypothetical protein|nr:hypothetical protein [Ferruginibacter sp.]